MKFLKLNSIFENSPDMVWYCWFGVFNDRSFHFTFICRSASWKYVQGYYTKFYKIINYYQRFELHFSRNFYLKLKISYDILHIKSVWGFFKFCNHQKEKYCSHCRTPTHNTHHRRYASRCTYCQILGPKLNRKREVTPLAQRSSIKLLPRIR